MQLHYNSTNKFGYWLIFIISIILCCYQSSLAADHDIGVTGFTVDESSGTATFTITADGDFSSDVITVDYTVSDNTATSPADHTVSGGATGSFTFDNGTLTRTVTINITDDDIIENSETLSLTLSNPSYINGSGNLNLTPSNATGTITDNDIAALSINDVVISEAGNAQFTVSITNGKTVDSGINLNVKATSSDGTALTPGDYSALSQDLTITGPATQTTVTVTVNDDNIIEPDETFTVALSNPGSHVSIGDGSGTATIQDNDTGTVSILNSGNAAEAGSAPGQFTVNLSGPSASDTHINYSVSGTATAGGTDYSSLSGTVTIPAGSTAAVIDVTGIVDDAISDADETVIVTLDSITSADPQISIDAANNSATVTIADNDSAQITITAADSAAAETGNDPGKFTVNQDIPASSDTVLHYTVSGSATPGADYSALSGL